jgi:cellulose synthase/poly-beta-1,6-N-acetylglucosamine synthase-like glycosyltransferase
VVIVAVTAWTVLLFVRGGRAAAHPPDAPPDGADGLTWVFMVPALNEEVTIRDSVQRLLAVDVASRVIVVIDDASTDATPDVLRDLAHPDLLVVRRELPDAQRGKAAALNHGYRAVRERLADTDHRRVIVVIVDADGRLAADAPRYAASHFADAAVGGVQTLVRIYNRHTGLTWCQDVEFSVYGFLFQAGRNAWGTAGMGGNGQFNRMAALDAVAGPEGPWRDRLTEDQDLGLRLVLGGWESRQELRATVEQQGLPGLRALFRQRTRWSQGNLQALELVPALARAPLALGPRLELLASMLMPLWQAVIGAAFAAAIVLAAFGIAPFWNGGPPWLLLVFYLLAFGGMALGCIAPRRSRGAAGWVLGFLIANVYVVYTWLLWPVLLRSTARQLTRRTGWAKTQREPVEPVTPAVDAG